MCTFDHQIVSVYNAMKAPITNEQVVPYSTEPQSIFCCKERLKIEVPNGAMNKGINASVAPYTANIRPTSSESTIFVITDLTTADGTTRKTPNTDASHINQLSTKCKRI